MIPDKDQKILWARAAGRCSMAECRRKLTLNKEDENEAVTLGEMCHIIGEKNKSESPRGINTMTLADRNRYSNLILLCVHHHRIIDKNEKGWSVNILHKIKDEHELWVDETLETKKLSPDELFYAETTDLLTKTLQLDNWNWFIDNAVAQLVHQDFIDAGDVIAERLLAIDWPTSKPELRQAMFEMMKSYDRYINQYLERAKPKEIGRDFFTPDNSYKKVFPNPNYSYESAKSDLWASKNFLLLCDYTVKLNTYVKAVREFSNPSYFNIRGNFLIVDSFGTHLGEWGSLLKPEGVDGIEEQISLLDNQIKELEKKKTHPNTKG